MSIKVIRGIAILILLLAILDASKDPKPKADTNAAQQAQAVAAQAEQAPPKRKQPKQKGDPCKDITPERWEAASLLWQVRNSECNPETRADKARIEREKREFEALKPILEKKFDARIREVLEKMPTPGEYALKLAIEKNNYSAAITYAVGLTSMADAETTARITVQAMLDVLLKEGVEPSANWTKASAWIYSEAKSVTGKELLRAYGSAYYSFSRDSIEWKPRK